MAKGSQVETQLGHSHLPACCTSLLHLSTKLVRNILEDSYTTSLMGTYCGGNFHA